MMKNNIREAERTENFREIFGAATRKAAAWIASWRIALGMGQRAGMRHALL